LFVGGLKQAREIQVLQIAEATMGDSKTTGRAAGAEVSLLKDLN